MNRFIHGFLIGIIFSLFFSIGSGWAQSRPLTLERLDISLDIEAMKKQLPVGADDGWLHRLNYQKQHRDREREVLSNHLPDSSDPTNFGGYINLITQNVALDFDPETGFIDEIIEITLVSNEDNLDKVPLSFPDHFNISSIETPEGESLSWQNSSNTLILEMDPPLNTGDELSFTLKADGNLECPSGGIKPCSFGGNFAYATHADYYLQGSPIVLDMFQGTLEVRVPSDQTVVATGRLEEAIYSPEGNTFRYTHDFETIYFSFAVSDYVTGEQMVDGIPIRVHTRQKDAEHHPEMLDIASDIVTFYASEFSKYPFFNLDMVQMDNEFGGGYGPQATVFMYAGTFDTDGGGGWGGGDSSRIQLVSHEIAHQWWGNFVNLNEAGSVILSEGLAEFSSAYHWQKQYDSRANFISNGMNYLYTVPPEEDVPIGSAAVFQSYLYNVLAYDKASVVFDMLQHELGPEPFMEGIHTYTENFGYRAAKLSDFFNVMEEVSGVDLTTFKDQWVNGTGYPRLSIQTESFQVTDEEWLIRLTINQSEENPFTLSLPLSVTFQGDHRKEVLEPIQIEGATTVVERRLKGAPLRINPDPEQIYLTRIAAMDQGDPNLSGVSDGSDMLDMAIMMHRNIVFSWGNNEYFYPNSSYIHRYDLDQNGTIDEDDLALFLNGPIEEETEETEETESD